MKNLISFLAVFVFLSGCALSPPKNHLGQKLIPLTHFFKNPQVKGYSISPNGHYFAFLKPYKNRMNIFVQDISQTKPARRITHQLDRDIVKFFWKENETILFIRDFGGDENFHIFRVSVHGTSEKDLTPFQETRAKVIDDLENIDPTHIIISLNKRDKKVFDAYRLNIKTGQIEMIAQNPGTFSSWLTDHKGRLRVATSTDGANQSIYYRDNEKKNFKKTFTTNFRNTVDPLIFTFDNKKIYVSSNLKRDKSAIVIFDPKRGKETKVIYKRTDVDVGGLSYSKKRKVLTSANYITWKRYYEFFDEWSQIIHQDLSTRLAGSEVVISSTDREEKFAIIRSYSDRSRGAYYLYNTSNKELKKLADISPWLNPSELAKMKPIQYKSRDGLTINGYLTLPNGHNKNLPTIVFPHGGALGKGYLGVSFECPVLSESRICRFTNEFSWIHRLWQTVFGLPPLKNGAKKCKMTSPMELVI